MRIPDKGVRRTLMTRFIFLPTFPSVHTNEKYTIRCVHSFATFSQFFYSLFATFIIFFYRGDAAVGSGFRLLLCLIAGHCETEHFLLVEFNKIPGFYGKWTVI